ncbi:WD40-like repeat protein [Natrinema pellirubrum DSM 15624]|nr:WD40-like repeat protein [Natrinema pellirubrum DSM 15624]
MFQYDTRNTGQNPNLTAPSSTVEEEPVFEADGSLMTPVIGNKTAYFGSSAGLLYAVDTETGTESWYADVDEPINAVPAVADSTIIVGSGEQYGDAGNVYTFDTSDGTQRWKYDDGRLASIMAVNDGTAYFGTGEQGEVHAVDVDSGTKEWKFDTGETIVGAAVSDGMVFFETLPDEGTIYALSADDGAVEWKSSINTDTRVPTVGDETVYVSANSDRFGSDLYALQASDGTVSWTTSLESRIDSYPVLANDTLYAAASDTLYAIDTDNGDPIWNYETGREYVNGTYSVGVTDNTVYFILSLEPGPPEAILYALKPDGTERWTAELEHGNIFATAPADGKLYLASSDGTLYKLS